MAKVISISAYQKPHCTSCVYTSNEAHFGFPICVNGMSPYVGEIITESMVCPYHLKQEGQTYDDLVRK